MNRQYRTVIVMAIAVATAALASFGVYTALQRMPVREVEVGTVNVVSAQLDGRILPVRKTRVTVYSHQAGLTDNDAMQLASRLKPHGFDVRITARDFFFVVVGCALFILVVLPAYLRLHGE